LRAGKLPDRARALRDFSENTGNRLHSLAKAHRADKISIILKKMGRFAAIQKCLRDQEVGGSNPLAPIFHGELRTRAHIYCLFTRFRIMRWVSGFVWMGLLIAGCSSRPARIWPPTIDAGQAGEDAITEYDKNGNGQIDGDEFDAVPALKAALNKVDKDSDKQVSADEITKRIYEWQESRVGIYPLSCRVTLDGKPLANAEITFVPEKFLGPYVKPAKGKSGPNGSAMLTIDDPDLAAKRFSGAQCGFYKIEVTGGGKTLPSKYNASTVLGEEVARDANWAQSGVVILDLKSK
jgi:hypothetical protein